MPSVDHAITSRPSRFSADELIPFGKYMLLNKIQSGATAAVYRAKIRGEAGFERLVAIKRILPQMSGDPEFVRTFIEEAKTCARLNHENICPIYELGKVGESLYMCMEWLPSKDLGAITRRLSRQGEVMPPLVAAWIAGRLCDALDYAHSLKTGDGSVGIIHRDLSPTNIVVSYEGQVKLIDFGLAKAAGRAQQTNVDALKLKLGYMSPELVLGRAPDARSDVFGVGVCLYEMITARRLFAGKDDVTTLRMVSNASVPPPSALVEDAPEELEQITMRALERSPEDRWQAAGDMGKELAQFIADTDPMFGPRQVAAFMRQLFAADIDAEQQRVNELMKASHDTAVLEERRRFFSSPAGAAAIAKAEAARRLSTLPPPARADETERQPRSARIPRAPRRPQENPAPAPATGAGAPHGDAEASNAAFYDATTHALEPRSSSPPAGERAAFEEERTTHYDPTAEEPTTFLPSEEPTTLLDTETTPLEAMTVLSEEKTEAFVADPEDDATHIFFNLEEGIGVPELVSVDPEADPEPEALPTLLTDSVQLLGTGVAPTPAQPAPPSAAHAARMADAPFDPARQPRRDPRDGDWAHLQTAPGARREPTTLNVRNSSRSDQVSTAVLVIGVIMVLLAVAGLLTKTSVGVKLGLRKANNASIEVRTTPATGASVTLDGIYRGKAPLRLEGVRSGERVIGVEADGYQGAQQRIELDSGERAQVLFELTPR